MGRGGEKRAGHVRLKRKALGLTTWLSSGNDDEVMSNVPTWGSPLGSTDWGWQQLDEESQVRLMQHPPPFESYQQCWGGGAHRLGWKGPGLTICVGVPQAPGLKQAAPEHAVLYTSTGQHWQPLDQHAREKGGLQGVLCS